jgi:hypothetical protein
VLIASIYQVFPLLWDGADTQVGQVGDGVDLAQDWGEAVQVTPGFDVDQRVSW